ncbi:MAG: UPF0280 family protein [Kiritimatiellae bacterium]|nr:UPF0280 family protein [Kiritimatiellia bacterium]
MSAPRTYRTFTYRQARFRICCDLFDAVTREIVRQRRALEAYIRHHPLFASSLEPVPATEPAPEVARRMGQAAVPVGVGPMAAVAGAMAQLAAEAALAAGAREVIVDNGGDVYLALRAPAVVSLYTGTPELQDTLAFCVEPAQTPLALCSSSGTMGHSLSLGACDLATVAAKDAALADAAATHAANLVKTPADIDNALRRVVAIPGVAGALIVKDDRVGLMGALPRLVRNPAADRE